MAKPPYTFAQFSADLARFGFASADDFSPQKLTGRHRVKVGEVHPDRPGGDSEHTKALNAARDRLRDWHEEGRPRLDGQAEPQPGFADTAAAARARAEAREAQLRREEEERAAQEKRRAEEPAAARRALERVFFWRRWRRRALSPLRLVWWMFVNIPSERLPWIVGALLFVFGWPFLQDSSYGRYVPHFPSIYAWLNGTDAVRFLKGQGGPWVNRSGALDPIYRCPFSKYQHPNSHLVKNNGDPYYDRPFYWDDDAPEEKRMDAMASAGHKWDPITKTYVIAYAENKC